MCMHTPLYLCLHFLIKIKNHEITLTALILTKTMGSYKVSLVPFLFVSSFSEKLALYPQDMNLFIQFQYAHEVVQNY